MFARKLAISLFLLIISLFVIPVVALAQAATPSALPATTYQLPTNIIPTSPIYTDLLINNMFHSFSCLAVGQSVIAYPCLNYQITKNAQGAIQGVPVLSQVNLSGGILGATGNLIGGLYMYPPVSTSKYLASIGQNLGIVKEAHAQGVFGSGASVLDPVLALWQISRNISYLTMIIIFVVIGLMVMFRNRINPQTVITAQAALPGLIIGLILITFSYFFASLLTDFAFIGTDVVGYYFSLAPQVSPTGNTSLAQRSNDQSAISIFSELIDKQKVEDYNTAANTVLKHFEDRGFASLSPLNIVRFGAAFINAQYTQLIGPIAAGPVAVGCGIIASFAPGLSVVGKLGAGLEAAGPCASIGNAVGQIVGNTAGGIYALGFTDRSIGFSLFLLAVIILIFSLIRLMIRLIQNYLAIIFLTISAPFTFLAASLPGRQGLATNWVLNMFCNVLSFPAVFAVFYFVAYLLGRDNITEHAIHRDLLGITGAASIAGAQSLPLFGGLDLSLIRTLLAFGALVATPSIPDIVCRAIGRIGPAGELIGKEYAGVSNQGQVYIRQAQGGFDNVGRSYGQLGPTFADRVQFKEEGGTLNEYARTISPWRLAGRNIAGGFGRILGRKPI